MSTLIDINGRTLTPDNVLTEKYGEPALVTAFPVANDADPTDHRQVLQRTLQLEILITETPFAKALTEIDYGEVALRVSTNLRSIAGPRGWQALYFIREAADAGTMAYSSTRLGLLDRLMLENMEYEVNARLDLRITLNLVQVVFAETLRTDLPPLAVRKKRPEVCPKVDTGDQGKLLISPDTTDPDEIGHVRNFTSGLGDDQAVVDEMNASFEWLSF